jgi:hypothetical protein
MSGEVIKLFYLLTSSKEKMELVEWRVLLLRKYEILGSNVCPETGCHA